MKINRYRLKSNITKEQLENEGFCSGGNWIYPECEMFKFARLIGSIELNIGFDDNYTWNDYDNVLVIDDEFGQPYFPFYEEKYYGKEVSDFEFLEKVIARYNETMDRFNFLERI